METMQTLEDLARRAGAITLEHFRAGVKVETKADQSPVSIADRSTEEFLRAEIARLFPGDTIVGEEFGETTGSTGRRWIVDPIDGTKSFIHGVPLYGVMIGLEEDGEIVAGAVYVPPLDELTVAARGKGCWWNGKRAAVSSTWHMSEALLLTTDVASNYKHGRGKAWDNLCGKAKLMRTWGDCYGHMLVATGRADVMVDPITSPWDCAALKVIVEEAGGSFTDYSGKPTIYANCAISTNGQLLDEVLELIK